MPVTTLDPNTALIVTWKSRIGWSASLVNVRPPVLPEVRTAIAGVSLDWLPAASTARTVNAYAVSAVRPDTVAVVPVTLVATVGPLRTS